VALGGKDEISLERVAHRFNVAASDSPNERGRVRWAGSAGASVHLQPFKHRRIKIGEPLRIESEVGRGIRHSSVEDGFAAIVYLKEEDIVVVHRDTDSDAVKRSRQLLAAPGYPLVVYCGEHDDGVAVRKQEGGTR